MISRSYVSSLFGAFELPVTTESEYREMHTILIYTGGCGAKDRHPPGGDNSVYTELREAGEEISGGRARVRRASACVRALAAQRGVRPLRGLRE